MEHNLNLAVITAELCHLCANIDINLSKLVTSGKLPVPNAHISDICECGWEKVIILSKIPECSCHKAT